jgi:purine-binding chemotaxis protein CheW
MDMRIKFRLGNANYDQFTIGDYFKRSLEAAQMRPTPGFGSVIDTKHIMWLGTS